MQHKLQMKNCLNFNSYILKKRFLVYSIKLQTKILMIITSIPSDEESSKSANVQIKSGSINLGLRASTSATFPKRPIIFLNNSALSGNSCNNQYKFY